MKQPGGTFGRAYQPRPVETDVWPSGERRTSSRIHSTSFIDCEISAYSHTLYVRRRALIAPEPAVSPRAG